MGGNEADDAAMQCGDGVDNDSDGFADASDPDCVSSATLLEGPIGACTNKLDDDGDGWADNSDPDCASSNYEVGFTSTACNDGVDNDGDGDVDADDADCALASSRFETLDECGDGVDNDGDGWVDRGDNDQDLGDPNCLNGGPSEGGGPAGLTQCSDGLDNDSDGDIDRLDTDCEHGFDTIEATEDAGEPMPFPLNYGNTLEEWSKDEDGKTIYYLNAGAAQVNPSNADQFWSLPQEWLAGFAHAKFADDELIVVPNDFHFMDANARDPDPTAYAEGAATIASYAPIWAAELGTYGGMNPADFTIKVEDNAWRPIDDSEAGLDNFVETHYSFVRFEGNPTFELGSSVKGDYQIFVQGRDSLSFAVLKGTFEVESIRKDRWSYTILEEDKINEHVEEAEEEGYGLRSVPLHDVLIVFLSARLDRWRAQRIRSLFSRSVRLRASFGRDLLQVIPSASPPPTFGIEEARPLLFLASLAQQDSVSSEGLSALEKEPLPRVSRRGGVRLGQRGRRL
jgi:hypothetical protein